MHAPDLENASEPHPASEIIVGIGASAGGLRALEHFVAHIPEKSGLIYVIVNHQSASRKSLMRELLQRHTRIQVEDIEDGMRPEQDRIYISPDGELVISEGVFSLRPRTLERAHLPIDGFFESLAMTKGHISVGILLSGTGSDGTIGLMAVKAAGGLTMVQDPASAEYDGMPLSAIRSKAVDYILLPKDMPDKLRQFKDHLERASNSGEEEQYIRKIFALIRSRTRHDFSTYKMSTIRRRIERRKTVHQIPLLKDYFRYLQENAHEIDLLFQELLINVTAFFRDKDAFESLRQILRERLTNKSSSEEIRVWIPACSSGEEPYSIAIILKELGDELESFPKVQIFATDLDAETIKTARAGKYPQGIAANVSKNRLEKFFLREDEEFRIRKDIREMVVFARHDILTDPPFTKLDLVVCRNLLIYLDAESQKRILPLFHYSLKQKGMLFLGTSESIGTFNEYFKNLDKKWKIFERKGEDIKLHPVPLKRSAGMDLEMNDKKINMTKSQKGKALVEWVESLLLKESVPPSVIINEAGEIVHFHGRTGPYLEPPSGQPNYNIFSMARPGLKLELTAAMRRASAQEEVVVRPNVRVKTNGDFQCIDLIVKKIWDPEALKGLYLAQFVPVEHALDDSKSAQVPDAGGDRSDLERELLHTRESLQSTVEELEASNEELKSTNEELQSTNEELQSTNEELETSKEETQSLNEELQTVNAELQSKIEELSKSSDDLTSLLNSVEVPTVFLDNKLHIKRFTKQVRKVINLIPSDVGRPVEDIVSKLKSNAWVGSVRGVLEDLSAHESEESTIDGEWYLIRISPYRSAENTIAGVVITFTDINELKRIRAKNTHAI